MKYFISYESQKFKCDKMIARLLCITKRRTKDREYRQRYKNDRQTKRHINTADILIGKKTVLDYLLKPILKAKQNALRER